MAKTQQKCPDCPAPAPAWLTTFSDLMSLLLTFFVLLLSFSTTKTSDFKKAIGSLQGALGVLAGDPILTSPVKLEVPIAKGDVTKPRQSMRKAKAAIDTLVKKAGQQGEVEVQMGKAGITIRIRDRALFDSGKAGIKPDMLPLLNKIGNVIARLPNPVDIEGHTDNVPIRNEEFPNNFWLSNARALKVLDLFTEEVGIAPERLSAIGHGEFKPLVPNDTPVNRAKNRRVEIKVRHAQGGFSAEQIRQVLQEKEVGIEGEE